MPLTHQVAQKLHGLSDIGGNRAHDLIDLQLIFAHGGVNLAEVHRIAKRLFANRRRQSWPPKIVKGENWDSLYADARGNLNVLPTCAEAVSWANNLIASIDRA